MVRGRSRSASLGDTLRTPPDSPPMVMARSGSPPPGYLSPPAMRGALLGSSDTSSPSIFNVERLFIAVEDGMPDLRAGVRRSRERPNPIISSEIDDGLMRSDGQNLREVGFVRSEKALGQGAFGKVWLGLRDNGEFLAIKEIQITQGDKYAERLEAVEKEIELMRNLDHPHIVRYLGSRRDLARGAFYILLEYVSCGSIQGLLKTMGGPLDEKVIRKYSRQILLGLSYLHSRNPPVAHRDIKS